jgi:hypothetical protein
MRVTLFECRQRSLRWGLLLPADMDAPDWGGIELRPLAVYPHEADGVAALRTLDAVLTRRAPAAGSLRHARRGPAMRLRKPALLRLTSSP